MVVLNGFGHKLMLILRIGITCIYFHDTLLEKEIVNVIRHLEFSRNTADG